MLEATWPESRPAAWRNCGRPGPSTWKAFEHVSSITWTWLLSIPSPRHWPSSPMGSKTARGREGVSGRTGCASTGLLDHRFTSEANANDRHESERSPSRYSETKLMSRNFVHLDRIHPVDTLPLGPRRVLGLRP